MVAILHTDNRIRIGDIRARMPETMEVVDRAGGENFMVSVASPNALSMRATRFRMRAGLLPRGTRGGSVQIEQYTRNFYPKRFLDLNSSKGWRDLTEEEVKDMREPNIGQFRYRARVYNRMAKEESANEMPVSPSIKPESASGGSVPGAQAVSGIPTTPIKRESATRGVVAGFATRQESARTQLPRRRNYHRTQVRSQPPRSRRKTTKQEPLSAGKLILGSSKLPVPSSWKIETENQAMKLDQNNQPTNFGTHNQGLLPANRTEGSSWTAAFPRSREENQYVSPYGGFPTGGLLPANHTEGSSWTAAFPRSREENQYVSPYGGFPTGGRQTDVHSVNRPWYDSHYPQQGLDNGTTSHHGLTKEEHGFNFGGRNHQIRQPFENEMDLYGSSMSGYQAFNTAGSDTANPLLGNIGPPVATMSTDRAKNNLVGFTPFESAYDRFMNDVEMEDQDLFKLDDEQASCESPQTTQSFLGEHLIPSPGVEDIAGLTQGVRDGDLDQQYTTQDCISMIERQMRDYRRQKQEDEQAVEQPLFEAFPGEHLHSSRFEDDMGQHHMTLLERGEQEHQQEFQQPPYEAMPYGDLPQSDVEMEQSEVARFAAEAEGHQWAAQTFQNPQSDYEPGPDEDFSQFSDVNDVMDMDEFEGPFFPDQYN